MKSQEVIHLEGLYKLFKVCNDVAGSKSESDRDRQAILLF